MFGQEDDHFIQRLEAQYTCPISKLPMTEPVMAADGHTYDRQNITKWFEENNKSPMTGLELPNTDLVSNQALKNIIHKINTEIYGFLSKEKRLQAYITQLKEEIDYLKVQLQHQKERNDEQIQKEEREFKSRKIQKRRHQDKDNQLNILRDQKNAFQKELLQLKTREQQLVREMKIQGDELSSLRTTYTQCHREKVEFEQKAGKYYRNRSMCMSKVRNSFSSNLQFICHMLHAIQQAKKYEPQISDQQKRQKGTEESINVDQQRLQERRNLEKKIRQEVIQKIQQGIQQRVCGLKKLSQEEEILEQERENNPQIRRVIIQRRIEQRRRQGFLPPPGDSVNAGGFGGLRMRIPPSRLRQLLANRDRRIQDRIRARQVANPFRTEQARPVQQPNTTNQGQTQPNTTQNRQQPQNLAVNQSGPLARIQEQNEQISVIRRRQGLMNQLDSIKWLMTKRDYKRFPTFYDYQFIKQHTDPDVYWFGVRIRVVESTIPFVEYLPHCWNHVRILDLAACNIDDPIWQQFIQSRHNFTELTFINLYRNNIVNVRKEQITDFLELKNFIIKRNRLNSSSIATLRQLKQERTDMNIEFDEDEQPQNLPPEINPEFF